MLGGTGLLRSTRLLGSSGLIRGHRVGGKSVLGIGDGHLETVGLSVQVAWGERLAKVSGLLIGAHLLEQGLALDVGVLGSSLASLVGQSGAALGGRFGQHSGINFLVLLDELVLESVEVGADAGAELLGVLEAEGADVHEDVVDRVLGLLVVHDVGLFAVVEGDSLIAEIRADLSEQCGVEGDGDGVRGAGEHLPLDGGNLGIKAATNLEEVDLGVALGADGVGAVGVGVKAGDIFAAVAKGTNQLKGAPARLARLEEQGLDFADGCAGTVLVFNDGVVLVLD